MGLGLDVFRYVGLGSYRRRLCAVAVELNPGEVR